jgi:DNA-binding beta-propeller fold protein YncE
MAIQKTVPIPCAGVNHADFAADGRMFVVSCEFSGQLLLVDTAGERVLRVLRLPTRRGMKQPMPQDVKLSPDGKVYYIADMMSDGVWLLSARQFVVQGFIATGRGAHGLYVTRDSRRLIITNRDEGSRPAPDRDRQGDRTQPAAGVPRPAQDPRRSPHKAHFRTGGRVTVNGQL